MRLYTLLLSLASCLLPTAVVSQNTSRIRSRTSTNAVCTRTGVAATATTAFAPLLSIHPASGEECPQSAALGVHYHNENDIGCCTQSAVLRTVSPDGKLACCECGSICTGVVPDMVDWTFTNGQFITTTGTGTVSTMPAPTESTTNSQTLTQSSQTSSSPATITTTTTTTSLTTSTPTTTTTTTAPGSASSALNVGYTTLIVGFAVGVFVVLLI